MQVVVDRESFVSFERDCRISHAARDLHAKRVSQALDLLQISQNITTCNPADASYRPHKPARLRVTIFGLIMILLQLVHLIAMHLLRRLKIIHFALGRNRCVLEIKVHFDGFDLSLLLIQIRLKTLLIRFRHLIPPKCPRNMSAIPLSADGLFGEFDRG
jgi:hypothetical protein